MMHKLFIVLLGALFMLASCTKDDSGLSNGMEKQFSIKVNTLPDAKTRTTALPKRYIMEIWHNEVLNGGETKSTLFQRIVQSGDKADQFEFRLITNQNYDFLVWVDYTNDATNAIEKPDYHYLTNATVAGKYVGLKGVQLIPATYKNKDDSRDAFFGHLNVNVALNHTNMEITCSRPFAQLNIYSTDWKDVSDQFLPALKPNKMVFQFTGYTQFNVLSGEVEGEKTMYAQASREITAGSSATEMHLTCDYLFAPATDVLTNGTATPILQFYNEETLVTDTEDMLTNISLQRNYITNVRGGLVSKKGTISIDVNPAWNTKEEPRE